MSRPWIGLDIETQGEEPMFGLQPCRLVQGHARISAISVASRTQAKGTLYPSKDQLRHILQVAKGKTVVGWNIAFDVSWLIAAGLEEEVFAIHWLDAMLLWRHWFVAPEDEATSKAKRKSYSLESALKEFFPDDVAFKEFADFQATDPDSLQLLLHRNKMDALFTLRLGKLFWERLTPEQQQCSLIEARCIPLVAKTMVMGLTVNKDQATLLDAQLEREGIEAYQTLIANNPEVGDYDLNSPKQLGKLLFERWQLPSNKTSKKTGEASTDKEVLHELALIDPRAKLIRTVRETKNNRTKFVASILKSLDYNGDGCTRPQPRIFGTYTGRMTYSSTQKDKQSKPQKEYQTGYALHQTKRGKEYRRIVGVPEGYGLVELDAAGQEFRWMAVASEDDTMLDLCMPGEDAHGFMGAEIRHLDYRWVQEQAKIDEPVAKAARTLGKVANLSLQYRTSAARLCSVARVQYGLPMELDEAQIIHRTYQQSYPGVPVYWRNQIQLCRQRGYAETFAGRRVQLNASWIGATKWQMESTAINYRIQGTGADQKYLALAIARNELAKWGGYLYFELHDGIFFLFPLDKIQAAAERFRVLFSNLPYKQAWGFTPPIDFPFDLKIGPNWGDLKG